MTANPRVLLIGAEWLTDVPGGLARYLADLAEALRLLDMPVRGVVLGPATSAPDYITPAGDHRASVLRRVAKMRSAAGRDAHDADVVDVHFALYGALPLLTAKLRGLPIVVHFHGPWTAESQAERQGQLNAAVKRRIERAVYRRAHRVVALSDVFGSIVTNDYGVEPSRVTVIPPGVDLDAFSPGDGAAARARLGVPPDAFVAVAARRLERRMGLDTLLDAWLEVQRARPDAWLLMAGTGNQQHALAAQARDLPDPDRVRLLGTITDADLVALYRAANCSVVPSRALEGFGLVTLESLACGTPTVVTSVGGLPGAITGLDPSLIVPPDDVGALASRLIGAANGDLPARAACRRHAETFNWREVARRHVQLYRDVASRGRRRVVFIDHTAQLSGGELALARLLPALDVDAHVILAEGGPLVELLEKRGATVEVLPMSSAARTLRRDEVGTGALTAAALSTRYAIALAHRLRQLDPDVVHTNSLKAALYGGLAARLARVPVVWHIRDRIEDDYLSMQGTRIVRRAARILPSVVIANSRATLATLRLPAAKPTYVIPSPVAVTRRPRPAHDSFTVGMVGRVAAWKGQDLFLDAFARAFANTDERALIVGAALFGEESYEAALRTHATDLGLDGRVEFRGHLDDVSTAYADMDIAVHASIVPEPFGQVVVEALAAGVPVVAADAGGPRETISDGVDGLLYPMGDAIALADRMRRLRDDIGLRERLVVAGFDRARAFTPDAIGRQVAGVYDQLC